MGTITIQITKQTTNSDTGGFVALYVSFPHAVAIIEAQRFNRALQDAISLSTRWQEGSEYATPRPPIVVAEKAEKTQADHHSKGGKARAASLSPERRSEIAREAAGIRWECKTGDKQNG